MPSFRPAVAFSGEMAMPGCEQKRAAVNVVCLAQCLQSDQAVDPGHPLIADLAVPAARFEALLLAALAPSAVPGDAARLPTGPPAYLRSQRLRL
jgi:hypothetical protein